METVFPLSEAEKKSLDHLAKTWKFKVYKVKLGNLEEKLSSREEGNFLWGEWQCTNLGYFIKVAVYNGKGGG